jgi:hypothetical protein
VLGCYLPRRGPDLIHHGDERCGLASWAASRGKQGEAHLRIWGRKRNGGIKWVLLYIALSDVSRPIRLSVHHLGLAHLSPTLARATFQLWVVSFVVVFISKYIQISNKYTSLKTVRS